MAKRTCSRGNEGLVFLKRASNSWQFYLLTAGYKYIIKIQLDLCSILYTSAVIVRTELQYRKNKSFYSECSTLRLSYRWVDKLRYRIVSTRPDHSGLCKSHSRWLVCQPQLHGLLISLPWSCRIKSAITESGLLVTRLTPQPGWHHGHAWNRCLWKFIFDSHWT